MPSFVDRHLRPFQSRSLNFVGPSANRPDKLGSTSQPFLLSFFYFRVTTAALIMAAIAHRPMSFHEAIEHLVHLKQIDREEVPVWVVAGDQSSGKSSL